MHYIISINNSNSASQLPLVRTILRIQWKLIIFWGNLHPLNCSVHCERTLYMKCKNITA